MPTLECVARGLEDLRAWWPSMPDSPALLESLKFACDGFDDVEFSAAIKQVVNTHEGASSPKPSVIRKACASVAAVRRAPAIQEQQRQREDDEYCPFCHTTRLTMVGPFANGVSRMAPMHSSGCPRYDAETYIPKAVNMENWPGRKPREPMPARAPTHVGNIKLPVVMP